MKNTLGFSGYFHFQHYRKGKLIRSWRSKNKVVFEGINKALDCLTAGASQVNPWYVGLLSSAPSISDSDGISDLSEFTNYSGNRKEWVDVRSDQVVDNSASKASFTINDDAQTIGGAFLCSVATGSSGILFSGSAFNGGDKSGFDTGDVLQVTYRLTGSNA